MSSDSLTRFDQPLRVELRFSRTLAAAAVALHGLAVLGCLLVPLQRGWQLLIITLLGGHCVRFYRSQVAATGGKAIGVIAWDKQRGWRLRAASGHWWPARLLMPVFVTVSLVVVRFRIAAVGTHSAVIVADRLGAEEFRRLRVRLLQSTQDKP
jgi:Membrane-bound toxin component of toxin-antitoxin system